MNVLIDCTNLKVGGGIQVATSFINDLNKIELKDDFFVVLSHQMKSSFGNIDFKKNIRVIVLNNDIKSKREVSQFLKHIEVQYEIDKVFCVFGPSYYKSHVPKVVGYAIPHYIYKDSPYFDKISWVGRLKSFFYSIVKVNLFKRNSDALIFETEDARDRFLTIYNFRKKSYVVGNSLNEVFADKSQWLDLNLSINAGLKILCLSANYPHKNLKIIPEIIEEMLANNEFDFKFVISLEKADLKFDSKYDQFIEYLGKVDLAKLPSLYQTVDVVFMPTLLEVFSATYLEAMYMEKPIVAADMSFARDICRDAALYFSPTSAKDAAAKILEVKYNNKAAKELTDDGIKNLKRFGNSMDRTKKYLDIILK